jgi:hypothetical protein
MLRSRRKLSGAAFAALVGALAASAAQGQDNSTVGPPQLRDFQLPGERSAPPRPVGPVDDSPNATRPAPQPGSAPPPVVTAPAPIATRPAPPPTPESTSTRPAARTTEPVRRTTPPAAAPSQDGGPAATPASPPVLAPGPGPFTPSEAPQTRPPANPAPPASAAGTGEPEGWNPLWLLLPLLIAAAAGLFFWRRRRGGDHSDPLVEETVEPSWVAPEGQPWNPPEAEPATAAAGVLELSTPYQAPLPPTPAPAFADAQRAWLEVEFKPSRAAATEKEAIVHYELVLRNVGDAPARNIRIDTKLFNAGAESDIKTFLDGPIHDHSGSPHVMIPPGQELRLGSTIAISKEDVREIVVEGRSLFVPAVAVNVAYNWGSQGGGRTSKSWLVGREAEQPSQKMGAFRLDLGPRIYRSVGQRQTGLAQMV